MLRYFIALITLAGCGNSVANDSHTLPVLNEAAKVKQEWMSNELQIDSINNIAKEGDIIFRGGTDIESNIIRDFSYKDKLFSHCGIILKTPNGLQVSHILGGVTNIEGSLLSQPIEDFLSYPENESAGIYATNLTSIELSNIAFFLDSLKKANVSFDLKFNLFTKNQLYCTEIIIDALRFAKGNNQLFPSTSFNLKNTKYFFLANKSDEFLFYPIDDFQHSKALKEKGIFYFPNYEKR